MYITKARKYHKDSDGKNVAYDYFRLTRKRYDQYGKQKVDHFCLGQLEGLTKCDRDELADMLTVMIEQGQRVMSFNPVLYEMAMDFYMRYRETHPAEDYDPVLRQEAERKEAERRRDLVTISIGSIIQKQARTIGPEAICRSTANTLMIREFLCSKGWSREQADLTLMQIIARAIYLFSELKTVRCLRDNLALLEMFRLDRKKVMKDALYQSAIRLWEVHREMEDFLHERVRSMFNLEEKILLLDISNTYFEGRMEHSRICFHGHSKDKRDDCKIVVLAAVVNTDGLLVRTMIYEGNRQDVTTVKEVVGTLAGRTSPEARKIVVMDAGFYSDANVKWLVENHFDNITVLPSGYVRFTADSDKVVRHEDCRHQEIRLQMGKVEIEGVQHKALLVDSDAKALKEQSMHEQAAKRYEEGLDAIRAGITKKGGHEAARCRERQPRQALEAIRRHPKGIRGHLYLRWQGQEGKGRLDGVEAQAGEHRRKEELPREVRAADQP